VDAEGVGCSCEDGEASPEVCLEQGCRHECQSSEPRFGCRCACINIR
jgi:hypothetical protein